MVTGICKEMGYVGVHWICVALDQIQKWVFIHGKEDLC